MNGAFLDQETSSLIDREPDSRLLMLLDGEVGEDELVTSPLSLLVDEGGESFPLNEVEHVPSVLPTEAEEFPLCI